MTRRRGKGAPPSKAATPSAAAERSGFTLPVWVVPAVLYLATVLLRIANWRMPIYGDEAWHFYAARYLGADAANVHAMFETSPARINHLFWWRPGFEILLAPAAFVSFDAWRLAHLLLTSLLPPLAYQILRDRGVRWPLALGGAGAILLLPLFQGWSVVVFPDALLATAFGAGLWAYGRGQPRLAAAFFLGASWVKEVGLVGFGVFTLYELRRRRASTLCPPRLARNDLPLAMALALAPLPLAIYTMRGGRAPGWSAGGDPTFLVDQIFVYLWFAPFLIVGVRWARTRFLSLLALAYAAFFLGYRFVLEGGVEQWYYVLPAFLALLAVAQVLDESWTRRKATRCSGAVAIGALLLAGGLVAGEVLLPATTPGKSEVLSPLAQAPRPSLGEEVRFLAERDREIPELLAAIPVEAWEALFLVDPAWFHTFYPFGDRAGTLRYGYTEWYDHGDRDLAPWVRLIEEFANSTIVHKVGTRLNLAIRDTYGDCIRFENDLFVVIDGRDCAGRGDQLVRAVAV